MESCLEETSRLEMTSYTRISNSPFRVMHIALNLGYGGRSSVILKLVKNMDTDKYSSFICCLDQPGRSESEISDTKVVAMGKNDGMDYFLPFRLAKVIKRENVTIVHTHESASMFYGTLAAKMAKIPVIVNTYHRGSDVDICSRRARIRNRIMIPLVDLIISVSKANGRVFADAHRIQSHRLKTIYNGVDFCSYENINVETALKKRKELGLGLDSKIIGTVGLMNGPEKGFEYLIRAFARVSQTEENATLILVGDGPLRSDLEQLSRDLNISSRIRFPGFRIDTPELYQIFDIFVLPSIYESFGLVLVEAMSAGKPVVATNVGGIPEIVQDGKTGIIVPPREPDKLAEAILRLMRDEHLSLSMGKAGQRRAEGKFSLAVMIEKYQNLYSYLLTKKTVSRKTATSRSRRKTRVMQLALTLDIGGLEMLVFDLVRKLDRRKYEPIVCCLQTGPLAEKIERAGIRLVYMEKRPGLDCALILRLARLIKRERIDILHSHNKGVHLYGALAAQMAGIPLIHTRHGRNLLNDGNVSSRFTLLRKGLVNRLLYSLTDLTVAVSYDSRKIALKQDRVCEEKVITIHNGVDVQKYARNLGNEQIRRMKQDMGIYEDDFIIGIVARLSPEKDHNILLEAFAIVYNKIRDIKLVIVGDGSLKEKLIKKALALELDSNVFFLGTREDIPEILKLFDVFVLSSYTEGIALTLLEAMSAGLPVIATNVGGNPEVVLDKVTGLLAPPRDPCKLADAIMQIASNREDAERMGRAGKKRVAEHFSLQRMVKEYEEAYDSLI